jgi:hypothetical protein
LPSGIRRICQACSEFSAAGPRHSPRQEH